jgi:serine/threonine protein kinase
MLQGVSLDRVLYRMAAETRPPTLTDVHGLLLAVSHAVEEVHSAGVIHGDIKPANLLGEWKRISPTQLSVQLVDLRIVLLDFEAAAVLENDVTANAGQLARGTPYFMAPERYAQVRINRAADVYSCSALAALLLTGRPERPGSQAGRRIPSPDLRAVIRRGMSVDVSARHQDMGGWRTEVDNAFSRMSEATLNGHVDWPADPLPLQQELSQQALTVTLGSVVRTLFGRVAQNIDLPTLDAALRNRYADLDMTMQRLLDAVWFEGLSLPAASKAIGIDPSEASRRLDAFIQDLEGYVRSMAVSRERALAAKE